MLHTITKELYEKLHHRYRNAKIGTEPIQLNQQDHAAGWVPTRWEPTSSPRITIFITSLNLATIFIGNESIQIQNYVKNYIQHPINSHEIDYADPEMYDKIADYIDNIIKPIRKWKNA